VSRALAALALLFSLAALAAACRGEEREVLSPAGGTAGTARAAISSVEKENAPVPDPPATELSWSYPDAPLGPESVVVVIPKGASPAHRLPVLVALHGQGESRKSPELGARGWPDDYGMLRAFERLASPPLAREDFGDMVDDGRLGALNTALAKRPYSGLIVVCPYLPDRFGADTLMDDAAKFGAFLARTVLPRVYRETPAIGTPATTAIDGVSLGGRAALIVGLSRATSFGAVGGIEPAFHDDQVDEIAALAARAKAANPHLSLRLMSATDDRFLGVTRALSRAFAKKGAANRLLVVPGDHSYEFNRGPGVYEMLLHYDRVLRGEDAP